MESYTPLNSGVIPLFIVYIFLILFGIFIIKLLLDKWKERNSNLPLYLSLVFISLILALIFLAIGLLETIITGYFKEIYRVTFPLAYAGVIFADILLFKFTNEITGKSGKGIYFIIIIGVILIILMQLPWNWWGVPSEFYADKLNIRIISIVSFALYSTVIYLSIAIISLKARRRAEEKRVRAGFLMYALSVLCMVAFFVMNIMENVLIVLFDHPGYSIFVYIGWIFAVLFIVLSYLSLIMPQWLRNLLNL